MHFYRTARLIPIAIIVFLWIVSVMISDSLIAWRNTPVSWNLAHALVSLRAFDEWGFWKLAGASVLLPNTHEFSGLNISTLHLFTPYFEDRLIYLSYPSLWLDIPYGLLKLLQGLGFEVALSPAYIAFFGLVYVRLLCGLVLYFIFLELLEILTAETLSPIMKRVIAVFGVVCWMFASPVLYFSYNKYFSTQAVLFPVCVIIWSALRCRFRFERLVGWQKAIIFVACITACGSDWYGFTVCFMVIIFGFLSQIILMKETRAGMLSTMKRFLSTHWPVWSGMVIVGSIYVLQLLYFNEGPATLLARIQKRSISGINTQAMTDQLPGVIDTLVAKVVAYFPVGLNTSGAYRWIVYSLLLSIIIASLYYLLRRSHERRNAIMACLFLFMVPALHILFLLRHSLISNHEFEFLKLSIPIIIYTLVLPVAAVSLLSVNLAKRHGILHSRAVVPIGTLILALAIVFVGHSRELLVQYSLMANPDTRHYKETGELVAVNATANELIIVDPERDGSLLEVNAQPPNSLWYAGRFTYSLDRLHRLLPAINKDNLAVMKPVFLVARDSIRLSKFGVYCLNRWRILPDRVDGREIALCRPATVSVTSLLNLPEPRQ
jgi:hypothetical protein